jgi:superfamily II DNA or RNA helicase
MRLDRPVGMIGDSIDEPSEVTVAMVQTCRNKRFKDFLKSRQVVIADEVHHLESDEWYGVMSQCTAPWRFGFSATPNLAGPGLRLLAMTGDIIFQRSTRDMIDRGVLAEPRLWFVPIDAPQLSSQTPFATVYKEAVVDNFSRNREVGEIAKRFRDEKKSCLILVNRIRHGQLLCDLLDRAGLKTAFVCGKVAQENREQIFHNLFSGKLDNVVAITAVVGEGTDLPELRALINATGGRGGGDASKEDVSGRTTIQILGRGLRRYPGKTVFDYVDFADQTHKFLRKASRDRLRTLRAEGYDEFIKFWDDYRSA